MRRIVVSEFLSLDGVMEDPGGAEGFAHGGWTFKFPQIREGMAFKLDETLSQRRATARARDLRGLRRGLAVDHRRGPRRVRGEDERHGEVRGLDHVEGSWLGTTRR